jgi:hypothetical protein
MRIRGALAEDHRDSPGNKEGQQGSFQRIGMDSGHLAGFRTLNQDERALRQLAEGSRLCKKATVNDGGSEIRHGLALEYYSMIQNIVTGFENTDSGLEAA